MASPGAHSDWHRLVSMLDSWAQAAAPHRDDIAVTLDSRRVIQVVVTPDDLEMLGVAFGALPDVFQYVTERLGSMPDDCDFLVYTQYDLEPFTARHLPPETEMPQFKGGGWFAYDPADAIERLNEPCAEGGR